MKAEMFSIFIFTSYSIPIPLASGGTRTHKLSWPPPHAGCRCSAHIKVSLSLHCLSHGADSRWLNFLLIFSLWHSYTVCTRALILSFPPRKDRPAYARRFNPSGSTTAPPVGEYRYYKENTWKAILLFFQERPESSTLQLFKRFF